MGGMGSCKTSHDTAKQRTGDDRRLRNCEEKVLSSDGVEDAVSYGPDRGRARHPFQESDLSEVVAIPERVDDSFVIAFLSR